MGKSCLSSVVEGLRSTGPPRLISYMDNNILIEKETFLCHLCFSSEEKISMFSCGQDNNPIPNEMYSVLLVFWWMSLGFLVNNMQECMHPILDTQVLVHLSSSIPSFVMLRVSPWILKEGGLETSG